jgi:hypothetical protein
MTPIWQNMAHLARIHTLLVLSLQTATLHSTYINCRDGGKIDTVEQGCQSQMDGGPNKKFSYKPRAGLFECSLKIF